MGLARAGRTAPCAWTRRGPGTGTRQCRDHSRPGSPASGSEPGTRRHGGQPAESAAGEALRGSARARPRSAPRARSRDSRNRPSGDESTGRQGTAASPAAGRPPARRHARHDGAGPRRLLDLDDALGGLRPVLEERRDPGRIRQLVRERQGRVDPPPWVRCQEDPRPQARRHRERVDLRVEEGGVDPERAGVGVDGCALVAQQSPPRSRASTRRTSCPGRSSPPCGSASARPPTPREGPGRGRR